MRNLFGSSFVSSLVFYGTIALLAGAEPAAADPGQAGCESKAAKGCELSTGEAGGAAKGCDLSAQDAAAKSASGEKVYVLGIEGMMCPTNCAPAVKESIESIEGVKSAEVDFEKKQAVVRTDDAAELTTKKVDASFANKGYFVSSLEVKSEE